MTIALAHLSGDDERLRAALPVVGELRVRAWADRGVALPGARYGRLVDEWDERAEHWLAYDAGALVGAARLSVHGRGESLPDGLSWSHFERSRIGVLARLCVAPRARGRGLASTLTELRVTRARQLGCDGVVGATSAGPGRVRGLHAAGFRALCTAWSEVTGADATLLWRPLP